MEQPGQIVGHFLLQGNILQISPLGNGLINDTYLVKTSGDSPDYVLQRINHAIFRNVEVLQHNIETVTAHIRLKLEAAGEADIERKVLRFVKTDNGKTYHQDENGNYWRISVFISGAQTIEAVSPKNSYDAGRAFGQFEAMLTDLSVPLYETIPDFHNMELRVSQLQEAIAADPVGRAGSVVLLIDRLLQQSRRMCFAEQLHREGQLPKRICHCDTKVNNMLFDSNGGVLCVIDLDTVMPSFVFSDYGDFLRTAANKVAEDEPDLSRVAFDFDIFRAFTQGYLESAGQFLTPVEIDNLPNAVALFPYMQSVRFLTDYINGDTYYKIQYEDHNLVRAQSQYRLFQCVEENYDQMKTFIQSFQLPNSGY